MPDPGRKSRRKEKQQAHLERETREKREAKNRRRELDQCLNGGKEDVARTVSHKAIRAGKDDIPLPKIKISHKNWLKKQKDT